MATLCDSGRIRTPEVIAEIERLEMLWNAKPQNDSTQMLHHVLSREEITQIDLFDQAQLATVIETCLSEKSLSAAGRKLFANSREQKKTSNDADRLSKYLQRFNLSWTKINSAGA